MNASSTIRRPWFLVGFAVAIVVGESLHAEPPGPSGLTSAENALVRALESQRIAAIERVYPSVVAIYGNDRGGGGSGVLFDAAGFALTNHHVVAAAGVEGWAGLADGKLYRWKLIGTDPGGDVAIIRLTGKDNFPTAPLADSDRIRVGDWAMAMGNPFVLAEDQRPTVTLGIVSGVKRFQEGQGMNQLVYGNCIQVDSSINPGNSGGPLFDIHGRVMGVNGRGSFEERGRVNVGLGYAISANQLKHFIPDLLATKIARHGTLDAVFTTRGGQAICSTINFDSPIARAGLELGDRLLEFEGETIIDANQFTNLICTLPEGRPVTVKFQRGEERITAVVRLSALPYEPIVKTPPKSDEPKDGEQKPEEPAEPKPADEPSDEKPASDETPKEAPENKDSPKKEPQPPKQIRVPVAPSIPLKDAGKIRDAALNQTNAALLLDRWRMECRAAEKTPAGLRWTDRIRRGDQEIGSQSFTLARDGRFLVTAEIEGKKSAASFDGKVYRLLVDGEHKEVSRSKASRNPQASQAIVLGLLLADAKSPLRAGWVLDGGDKSQNMSAARFSQAAEDSEALYLWSTMIDDSGRPWIQLLKSGVGLEDDEPIPAVTYHDWKPIVDGGLLWPQRRTLVRGLAETPIAEMVLDKLEILADINHVSFNSAE